MINDVREGKPLYIVPYREPKVWGATGGIGEFWYGAEGEGKSAIVVSTGKDTPLKDIVEADPEAVLGAEVVKNFGKNMPLVKILTPKGRLSAQFHEEKNELWIITGIDKKAAGEDPSIILGYSSGAVEKYGKDVSEEYRKALIAFGEALNALIDVMEGAGLKETLTEHGDAALAAENFKSDNADVDAALNEFRAREKEVESFYNYRPVKLGDVVPIAHLTLHALGSGIEIIEPQIFGTTQSTEDGATYPVRYYFPGYERPGAKKPLDIDRVSEMRPEVAKEELPEVIKDSDGVKVEKMPGDFSKKGLEVLRLTLEKGKTLDVEHIDSFHNLVSVYGDIAVEVKGESFDIPKASPGGEMMIVPAAAGSYKLTATSDAQIIDTFSPVPE